MNILWITNIILPAPCKALNMPAPVFGGWMHGLAMQVASSPDIRLAVASTYQDAKLKSSDIDKVTYYLLPAKSTTTYQKSLEQYWQTVCNEFKPDVVHIHGTEYALGLACMRACPSFNYVISIQGLIGICSRYYYASIKYIFGAAIRPDIKHGVIIPKSVYLVDIYGWIRIST